MADQAITESLINLSPEFVTSIRGLLTYNSYVQMVKRGLQR